MEDKKVTEKKYKEDLDIKIQTYKTLFEMGNLTPNEDQVDIFLSFKKYNATDRTEFESNVKRKIQFYERVGLIHRAEDLERKSRRIKTINSKPKVYRIEDFINNLKLSVEKGRRIKEKLDDFKEKSNFGNNIDDDYLECSKKYNELVHLEINLIQNQILFPNKNFAKVYSGILDYIEFYNSTIITKCSLTGRNFNSKFEISQKSLVKKICEDIKYATMLGIKTSFHVEKPIGKESYYEAVHLLRRREWEKSKK